MAKHIGLAEGSKKIIYASGTWSGHRIFINASCDSFNVLETTSQPLAILIMWRSLWNKSRAGIWAREECGNSTLARLAFCGFLKTHFHLEHFHLAGSSIRNVFFSDIWVVFSLLRSYSHIVYFGRLFFLVLTNTMLVVYIIQRGLISTRIYIFLQLYTSLHSSIILVCLSGICCLRTRCQAVWHQRLCLVC